MGRIVDWLLGREHALPKPPAVELKKEVVHHAKVQNVGPVHPRVSRFDSPTAKPTYDPAKARVRQEDEDRRRKQREEDDSGPSILGAVVAAEVVSSVFDSSPSADTSSSSSDGFSGFGGGESGGGGASGSW